MQALLEVVDSGAKNMEIAIVRFGKANEVRTRVDVGSVFFFMHNCCSGTSVELCRLLHPALVCMPYTWTCVRVATGWLSFLTRYPRDTHAAPALDCCHVAYASTQDLPSLLTYVMRQFACFHAARIQSKTRAYMAYCIVCISVFR